MRLRLTKGVTPFSSRRQHRRGSGDTPLLHAGQACPAPAQALPRGEREHPQTHATHGLDAAGDIRGQPGDAPLLQDVNSGLTEKRECPHSHVMPGPRLRVGQALRDASRASGWHLVADANLGGTGSFWYELLAASGGGYERRVGQTMVFTVLRKAGARTGRCWLTHN